MDTITKENLQEEEQEELNQEQTISTTDDGYVAYHWIDDTKEQKRKLAERILLQLIAFNLKQLSRTDAEKVKVYEDPVEDAVDMASRLYQKME